MAKITPRKQGERETITVRTKPNPEMVGAAYKWWEASARDKMDLAQQVLATATFLKEQQQYRYRQSSVFAKMYGNIPLFGTVGTGLAKMASGQALPLDRPTMNVVQSCIDTLVSRITQQRPSPTFLTNGADYKTRNLAKQLNNFIGGEFHQVKAYQLGEQCLRDAGVLGTGCVKIYEDRNKRVAVERVLYTELLVDPNESLYGDPRQLYQFKLVDRSVLQNHFPQYKSQIAASEQAYPETSSDSSKTVSDQVMVVEAWHLRSGPDADDGRHTIACSGGLLLDEDYEKDSFPFVFLHYSPRMLGFWGQGLSEQLMGTQIEINKLLMTISSAINLVGVPRVFVEDGSKIVSAHLNNQIGAIVKYRGTKPVYEVAPCMPAEVYAQLQRLVQYAYQQSGVSALAAQAQKPAGLNSGEAIRSYDDLQSDRFTVLARRYVNFYIDLAYQIVDKAKEIADREGKYQTVFPNKDGTKEIDLPKADLLKDPFVIQVFDQSSLPKDPAGRLEKVAEMAQSGMITIPEARRLLGYPDIEQIDRLANSSEERILKIMDEIVESGKYTPPDPFMDLNLATDIVRQYYNLYVAANLEESKAEKLRTFFTQLMALQQAAQPPAPGPQPTPTAVPQAPPTSPLLPNVPQ